MEPIKERLLQSSAAGALSPGAGALATRSTTSLINKLVVLPR